jgi:putative transposase|tara:strand:- start:174 stop:617 length:444 start_codon:yes stop_codon:yes gene_type:complete
MSEFKRVSLAHSPPSWVKDGSLFFLTICCEERGRNQLCDKAVAESLLGAASFYMNQSSWFVRLFLLMPDHCHALISFPPDSNMSGTIGDWKRFTAKKTGVVWQKGYFDHRIRCDESWEEKADYIRMNPVRKDLVLKSSDWPWVLENK